MEFCDVFIWRVETVLRWKIRPDKKRARTHASRALETRGIRRSGRLSWLFAELIVGGATQTLKLVLLLGG